MLPKNVSARTVGQNNRTEKLAEKNVQKTTIKMTVLKCCPILLRVNGRSKNPYQKASWKSVRENYL